MDFDDLLGAHGAALDASIPRCGTTTGTSGGTSWWTSTRTRTRPSTGWLAAPRPRATATCASWATPTSRSTGCAAPTSATSSTSSATSRDAGSCASSRTTARRARSSRSRPRSSPTTRPRKDKSALDRERAGRAGPLLPREGRGRGGRVGRARRGSARGPRACGLAEIGVFYRTNAQSARPGGRLPPHGVPYHIVGSVRVLRAQGGQGRCSPTCACALNPADDLAFTRAHRRHAAARHRRRPRSSGSPRSPQPTASRCWSRAAAGGRRRCPARRARALREFAALRGAGGGLARRARPLGERVSAVDRRRRPPRGAARASGPPRRRAGSRTWTSCAWPRAQFERARGPGRARGVPGLGGAHSPTWTSWASRGPPSR